jgi:hypothetical protein
MGFGVSNGNPTPDTIASTKNWGCLFIRQLLWNLIPDKTLKTLDLPLAI